MSKKLFTRAHTLAASVLLLLPLIGYLSSALYCYDFYSFLSANIQIGEIALTIATIIGTIAVLIYTISIIPIEKASESKLSYTLQIFKRDKRTLLIKYGLCLLIIISLCLSAFSFNLLISLYILYIIIISSLFFVLCQVDIILSQLDLSDSTDYLLNDAKSIIDKETRSYSNGNFS